MLLLLKGIGNKTLLRQWEGKQPYVGIFFPPET